MPVAFAERERFRLGEKRSHRLQPVMRGWTLFALALLVGACASASFDSQLRAGQRLIASGSHREAAARLESALDLAAATPVDVISLVTAQSELADIYLAYPDLGEEENAESLLLTARKLADEHLAADHALRLNVLERLGTFYLIQNRWSEAEEPLETYLSTVAQKLGPEAAYTSLPATNLTEVYSRLGKQDDLARLRRLLANPQAATLDTVASQVAEIEPERLYLQPNVQDIDGAPAFVHFTPDEMPLTVAMSDPDVPARDATPEQTSRAVIGAFRSWEVAIRRVLPWFRLEFREHDADADVQVIWRRRPRGYLPARGRIGYRIDGGELRVQAQVVLSTQPVPSPKYRITLGQLRAHALHAFGSALGLPDCTRCDSMLSMAWQRRKEIRVTDLDIRTYEALVATPNGLRADGAWLAGLTAAEALPRVGLSARHDPRRDGVLADVPFINTGRGGSVVIDIAPEDAPSFVVTLDTGATDTVLTTNYARALGISVRAVKTDPYRRRTITGDPLAFWVTGQRVVGGGRGPTHFDYALLGAEFLERYVVELDFERRRVRFLDPGLHRVGDGRGRRVGEVAVDLELRERRPYARLELGSGEVWALVDTGAETPLSMTEEKARELGLEIDRSATRRSHVNVLGRSMEIVQTLPEVRMGPIELRDVQLLISIGDESSVRISRWLQDQTILGIEILENYIVRFDYPRQKLGLTPIPRRVGRVGPKGWKGHFAAAEQALAGERWKEAEREHREAVRLAKAEDAPPQDLADALSKLGDAYVERRRSAEALSLLANALSLMKASAGEKDPAAIRIMGNVAALYHDQGNLDQAAITARRAYTLAQKSIIPDLAVMGRALNTQANVESDLGNYSRAAKLYRRALVILEDALGPGNRDVASVRTNLAAAYLELGRPADAVPLLTQTLMLRAKLEGADHPDVARLHEELGFAYGRLGENEHAAEHYEHAVAILEENDRVAPGLAEAMNGLALVYRKQKRYSEAEGLYQRSLSILEDLGILFTQVTPTYGGGGFSGCTSCS